MSKQGLIFASIYVTAIPIQFYNMLDFTYDLGKSMENSRIPRSLITPIECFTLFTGAIMWPISLPLMVMMDMKNVKN